MKKYKIICKEHSDIIIEADYIDVTEVGITRFYIGNILVGTSSKDNTVVQI